MKTKFSVADRVTGEWIHFTYDLSDEFRNELISRRDPMGFLQEALSDDRFDGRAMIWEPDHGEA